MSDSNLEYYLCTQGAVGGADSESPEVSNILKTLQAFRKREFKPNPLVNNLIF